MPIRLYPYFLITLGAVNLVIFKDRPQMVILGVVFLAWGFIVIVWQFANRGMRGRRPTVARTAPAAAPPSAAPAPPATPSFSMPPGHRDAVSVSDELRKLSALRDEGVLTDAEFNAQKRKLLS